MKKLLLVLALCFTFASAALAAVNINTATKDELTSLKGVGEKKAQAIIDYRKKNGDFKTVDDLEKVEGIGPGMMKQIRTQLSVTGKTTIDKPVKATKVAAVKAEKAKGDDKTKIAADNKKMDDKGKSEKKAAEKDTKKAADSKDMKDEKKSK